MKSKILDIVLILSSLVMAGLLVAGSWGTKVYVVAPNASAAIQEIFRSPNILGTREDAELQAQRDGSKVWEMTITEQK